MTEAKPSAIPLNVEERFDLAEKTIVSLMSVAGKLLIGHNELVKESMAAFNHIESEIKQIPVRFKEEVQKDMIAEAVRSAADETGEYIS